jgi:hypothetical protein
MPVRTTSNAPTDRHSSLERSSLEVAIADSMQGNRNLIDVLDQIDGLGPSRRRNIENFGRPTIRKKDVSSMNEESTDTPDDLPVVRQREQITPAAPEPLFKDDTHRHDRKITQSAREMLAQTMNNRGRRHSWPTFQSQKEFFEGKSSELLG